MKEDLVTLNAEIDNIREKNSLTVQLIDLYIKRAKFFLDEGFLNKASEDLTAAMEIIHSLSEAEKEEKENILAVAFVVRGQINTDKKKYWDAVKDFTSAIEIQEKLLKNEKLTAVQDLISSYMNRAMANMQLDKPQRAIDNYNKAISLLENNSSEGASIRNTDNQENNRLFKNDLATAYMSRATALVMKKDYNRAIDDLTKSINIQEELKAEGKLMAPESLLMAYRTRYIAYSASKRTFEAQSDLQKLQSG